MNLANFAIMHGVSEEAMALIREIEEELLTVEEEVQYNVCNPERL